MKIPVNVFHHLGHSISYDMVCPIQTVQAELSQELLKTSNMLPVKPDHESGTADIFKHTHVSI